MSLTVDEVKGLSTLPEDDLTVEEAIEISQKLEEEKDKEAQEESEMSLIVKTLAMLEDAPTEADIENWKSQYGTIHISTILNGSDLYLWRTLRRQEYKQLMKSGFLNEVLRGEEAKVYGNIKCRCSIITKRTNNVQIFICARVYSFKPNKGYII